MERIPVADVARQHRDLHDEILAALDGVVRGGWYVQGEQHRRFEEEFAAYQGRAHAVGVANGTDALELALRAVGCGPGSRVATVANAGGYTTAAVLALGATPVFVDVDDRLLMDPADLARVLDETGPGDLAAVVVTHLYGQIADVASIQALLKGRGIPWIEDCAQAHGAERGGVRAGSFGDLAAFSFYPTKNLGAIGDGGAVVTDRADLAERLRRLRQYGWQERFVVEIPGGRNSRLDEIQAAVLRLKLPRLDAWNEARRAVARRYRGAAEGTRLRFPQDFDGPDHVAHLCVGRHPEREAFRARLNDLGIATAVHYPRLDYQQPGLQERLAGAKRTQSAEAAVAEIVTLPCFPELTDAEVDRVCRAIESSA